MENPTIIFYIIAAVIPICGFCITIGLFKGKVKNNTAAIADQVEQNKTFASKDELAAVITRSDEKLADAMRLFDEKLESVKQRGEEDRGKGQAQWREFHNKTSEHAERLSSLETRQTTIVNTLDEIKADFREMGRDVKEILRRLPQPQ